MTPGGLIDLVGVGEAGPRLGDAQAPTKRAGQGQPARFRRGRWLWSGNLETQLRRAAHAPGLPAGAQRQQQPEAAAAARRQQQPTGGGEVIGAGGEPAFADDGGGAAFQRLLHRPKSFLSRARARENQPRRIGAERLQPRAIGEADFIGRHILDNPDDLPAGTNGGGAEREREGKTRRRAGVAGAGGKDFG